MKPWRFSRGRRKVCHFGSNAEANIASTHLIEKENPIWIGYDTVNRRRGSAQVLRRVSKAEGKMRKGFCGVIATLILAVSGAARAEGPTVAGLTPSERPAGAPVISELEKDAAWYAHALTGIEPPFPASLRFLEDQGAWFSPFVHPGMTGPYDIRRWHGPD